MMHAPRAARSRSCCRWLAALVLGLAACSARTATAATPEQVDAAVKKAVDYLISKQKNGNWETDSRPHSVPDGPSEAMKWGGETAIATYALLAADESWQSPPIRSAVAFLEKENLHGTYAVGLRSQVWNLLPDIAHTSEVDAAMTRDRDFMLYSRIQRGPKLGFYGYAYGGEARASAYKYPPLDKRGPLEGAGFDRSNSQYGVLGAWALEQAGAEIPVSFWKEEDEAWRKAQQKDGGWSYNNGTEVTLTMTSAGIATLFITQDYILQMNSKQFDVCNGGIANPNIDQGLAWMDKHVGEAFANTGGFYYYGLYGIERIGVASGRKYFGDTDWYKLGADALVKHQQPTGSFGTIHDTAFAILFLVRGRAPVMMNKLIYASPRKTQVDPWNERPRDTANLARWMGKHSVESFFNWQVVNLTVPVEELHDAPILYIAGSEVLSFTPEEIDKLRAFVEQGGMILGNADAGSISFGTSFKALGKKMFKNYEFRELPRNHPIYSEQYLASKWRMHPTVEGMSNGIRELMILVPAADLSRAWQTNSTKTREESFQLAGNIFLYATGKENVEHKGATYVVLPLGFADGEIKVARLQIGKNWDPEPGGWRRLANIIHNDEHMNLKVDPVELSAGTLAGYKIAHLTGTERIALTDIQRNEIKNFVANGGTLIIDAAGGSTEFADSIEAELTKMFGDAATAALADPLSPETEAFADFADQEGKTYRSYVRGKIVGSLRNPRIRGIMVANAKDPKAKARIGVFYSREDLSAGLVGEPVDGVLGYEPKAATYLMENIVMWIERGRRPLAVKIVGKPVKSAKPPASAPASVSTSAAKP